MATDVRAALPAFLSCFFPFAGHVVAYASTGVPKVAGDSASMKLVVAEAARG